MLAIASTMGTARFTTQGSCRPFAASVCGEGDALLLLGTFICVHFISFACIFSGTLSLLPAFQGPKAPLPWPSRAHDRMHSRRGDLVGVRLRPGAHGP